MNKEKENQLMWNALYPVKSKFVGQPRILAAQFLF